MGQVRPFAPDDIAQVARVHRAAFKLADTVPLDSYREYLTRVFLENPAGRGPVPSLVYDEGDGRILGFLGVVPRRLELERRRLQAVVSSQFVVDPAGPAALVALRLLKAYMDGPQDVSIADEATEAARRIWEGLGGTTARLMSLYWMRPLRPAGLALSWLRRRRRLAPLAAAAAPLASAADALAGRMGGAGVGRPEPPAGLAEWCTRTALAQRPDGGAPWLRVEYDDGAFEWLLDRAAAANAEGVLLKAVPRRGPKVLGWYVCHVDGAGTAEVLQLAATASSIDEVLDHLFHQAWRQGALAVGGRLEPRFMQALSDKHCLFHRHGPWVLVNSRDRRVLEAFQNGEACFSRLDGEWPLRFRPAAH